MSLHKRKVRFCHIVLNVLKGFSSIEYTQKYTYREELTQMSILFWHTFQSSVSQPFFVRGTLT